VKEFSTRPGESAQAGNGMPGERRGAPDQTRTHAPLQKKPGPVAPPVYRPTVTLGAAPAPYRPNAAVPFNAPEPAAAIASGALNGGRGVPGLYRPQVPASPQARVERTAPPVYRPATLAPAPPGMVPTVQMTRRIRAEDRRRREPPVPRPYVGRRRANRMRQDAELEENLRALGGDPLSEDEDSDDGDLVPAFNMYSLLPVERKPPRAIAPVLPPVPVMVVGPGIPAFPTTFGANSVKLVARDFRRDYVSPIWDRELARQGRRNQEQLKSVMESIRRESEEQEIRKLMKALVDLINNPTSMPNATNVNAVPTATATTRPTAGVGPGASARAARQPKFVYSIEHRKTTKYNSTDHFWPSDSRDPHIHYYGGLKGSKADSGHCKIGGSEYKFGPGVPRSNANIDDALLAIWAMTHISARYLAEYIQRLNDKRR
jgi:hypothetical protein